MEHEDGGVRRGEDRGVDHCSHAEKVVGDDGEVEEGGVNETGRLQ